MDEDGAYARNTESGRKVLVVNTKNNVQWQSEKKKEKKKGSLGVDWPIAFQPIPYPEFCSMKQLGVFLLPLDGMIVVRSHLNDTIIVISFSPNKNKDNAY